MANQGNNVEISITVVDKDGNAAVQALNSSLAQVEQTGASAGAAVAASLDGVSTATKKATLDMEAYKAHWDAWHAKMRAMPGPGAGAGGLPVSSNGKTVAQLTAEWEAEQAALKAADDAAKAASKGAVGLAGSYGEARIAASALMGSTRGMAMGLANVGSRAQWLAPLWSAAMPVAVGVAAVSILGSVAEAAYHLYEKYIDLDAAAEAYNKEIAKKKDADFVNPHTFETATLRLDQATAAVTNLHDAAESMRGDFWREVLGPLAQGDIGGAIGAAAGNLLGSRSLADASAKSHGEGDALAQKQMESAHQLAILTIDRQHAADGRLKGEAAITAELQKQMQIHRENQKFEGRRESRHGNTAPADTGKQVRDTQDAIARGEASAKRVELARKETDEIMRMRAEALQAGLTGNALYAAHEVAAYDAIERKFQEGELSKQGFLQETAETEKKFAAEALKRQDDLDERVRKSTADAAIAGLTGIARIQAETQAALQARDDEERKFVGGGVESDKTTKDFSQLRANDNAAGNQKIFEANKQFFEQMRQMQEGYDAGASEGYARIADEAEKADQRVRDAFSKLSPDSANYAAAHAAMQKTIDSNDADAAQKMDRLHQQTMDSLRKEEELAARDTLPPWIAAEMAIVDTYNDRVNKAKEAEDRQLAYAGTNAALRAKIENDFEAQKIAAGAVANAQRQKQDEETRDKLGSSLQSFFQNPTQFIEKRAMDSAFQFMGNEMSRMFNPQHPNNIATGAMGWLFGMNGQASTSTNPVTFGRSLMGMGGDTAATSTLSVGATTLQTGATTLQMAADTLQSAATSMTMGGGGGAGLGGLGGGLGSDMGMGGFGGISAGSTNSGSAGVGADPFAGMGGGGDSTGSMTLSGNPSFSGGGTYDPLLGQTGSGLSGVGSSTASGMGKWAGAAGAAVTGGVGIYDAFTNSNPLAGAVSGGMAGAAIGSAIAPGIGTAIGAVVGGVAGLLAGIFGDQGEGKAQDLDKNTVQLGILTELQGFNTGTMGYDQATQALYQMQIQADSQTQSWGSGARGWYSNHILPEILAARMQLDKEEKGGRSLVKMSAAQYHDGGWINDFGDMALNASEGLMVGQRGEFMMNARAASTYAPELHAMNSGALPPSATRGSQMVPASSAGTGPSIQIVAWDGKSVDSYMRNGGATKMRQALNLAGQQYGGLGVR